LLYCCCRLENLRRGWQQWNWSISDILMMLHQVQTVQIQSPVRTKARQKLYKWNYENSVDWGAVTVWSCLCYLIWSDAMQCCLVSADKLLDIWLNRFIYLETTRKAVAKSQVRLDSDGHCCIYVYVSHWNVKHCWMLGLSPVSYGNLLKETVLRSVVIVSKNFFMQCVISTAYWMWTFPWK